MKWLCLILLFSFWACSDSSGTTPAVDVSGTDSGTSVEDVSALDSGSSEDTQDPGSEDLASPVPDVPGVEEGPELKNEKVQLMVKGVVREYRLYIPSERPESGMPLVMAFHGGGARNWPYPQEALWHQLSESEGFAMVYPLSELLPGNEGEWQLNTAAESRQDLDFVEAIIDDLAARYTIDETKVYASGYSLGGMFIYELACNLSSRFAALASHAGTMPVAPSSCEPEQSTAIIHTHSTTDFIIAYGNRWDWKEWDSVGTMMDIPSLVDYWSTKFSCQTETETEAPSSLHIVHEDCEAEVRVEHYRLDSGQHDWPDAIGAESTHEILWSFFEGFSKP